MTKNVKQKCPLKISSVSAAVSCLLQEPESLAIRGHFGLLYSMFTDPVCEVPIIFESNPALLISRLMICKQKGVETEISIMAKRNLAHGIDEHTVVLEETSFESWDPPGLY